MVNAGVVVTAIIGIVIAVVVATSLGNTIVDQTDTSTASALENASDTSKTMYGLVELLYPIVLVMFMITVGFAVGRKV